MLINTQRSERSGYLSGLLTAAATAVFVFGGPAAAQPCEPSGWTLTLPAPGVPARQTTAAAAGSGNSVVLFGGFGGGQIFGDTWVRTLTQWERRDVPGPSARLGHSMAFDPVRDRTVLFGGVTSGGVLAETWEWNGSAWAQINPIDSPSLRTGAVLVYGGPTRGVLLVGGEDSASGESLFETWSFDGINWTNLGDRGISGRTFAAAAYDAGRDRVVVYGGVNPATFAQRADTWEFDGSFWSPTSFVGAPGGRLAASMAYDSVRSRVVLYGGVGADTLTYELDGANWTLAATQGPAAGLTTAFHGGFGRVIQLEPEPSRTLGWNGSAWTVLGSQEIPAINAAAAAIDPVSGRPTLFGGTTFLGRQLNTLWALGPSGWELVAEGGPLARDRAGLAADTQRNRLVMFGGADVNSIGMSDTWAWNGSVWSELAISGPPPRSGHAMAYDPLRDRVVVFGGRGNEFETLGDTWVFNGASWSRVMTPASPTARSIPSMTFDASRGKVVLFGGSDANFEAQNDLWEFDGSTWTRIVTPWSPGARLAASLSYDAGRGRLVMVGGQDDNFTVLDETWLFSAATGWQNVVAPSVGARTAHAAVFDPARGRVVLFGGFDNFNTLGETWVFDTGLSARITAQPQGGLVQVGQVFTATAAATSTRPLAYQWIRDGVALQNGPQASGSVVSGATSPSLTITGTARSDAGAYRLRATDACGGVQTLAATLTVFGVDFPVVTQQPLNASTCPAGAATFGVTVTSDAPGDVTYQWQASLPGVEPPIWFDLFDGQFVVGELTLGIFSGTQSNQLTASATPEGWLTLSGVAIRTRCLVTNIDGSATSQQADLLVCGVDFTCDGFLNQEDLSGFLTAFLDESVPPGPSGTNRVPCAELPQPYNEFGYAADFNRDCTFNQEDLSGYITEYFLETEDPASCIAG